MRNYSINGNRYSMPEVKSIKKIDDEHLEIVMNKFIYKEFYFDKEQLMKDFKKISKYLEKRELKRLLETRFEKNVLNESIQSKQYKTR